jgi:peroxisomal 3,2-trans-enoyl-CoA isomerase
MSLFQIIFAPFNVLLSVLFPKKKVKKGLKTILVSVDELGVAKILLNRPRKKNAFNEDMYVEVTQALETLSNDAAVKVVLIVGSGDFYSSGNDLSNFSKLDHPLNTAAKAMRLLENFVNGFINLKAPIVVAVNGPAIGIAATTLGLCDKIFVSETAYFKTPFSELGQSPEGCSSYLFPKLMGKEISDAVLWKSKKLSATEALDCGFVYSVQPFDQVENVAYEYCKSIAILPSNSKELIRYIVSEKLVDILKNVNKKECEILGKKIVSKECFLALACYLENKNMKMAAFILR